MRAVGAMSGTSMDGVDLAVIETDGVAVTGFGATGYRPYSKAERAVIRAALGRWTGEAGVAEAARVVEDAHLEALAAFDAGEDADVFGFHGQTLAHDPDARRPPTRSANGARIAAQTGLTTVWDFRSNDMELGGQGGAAGAFLSLGARPPHRRDAAGGFFSISAAWATSLSSIRGWSGRSCPAPALPSTRGRRMRRSTTWCRRGSACPSTGTAR